MLKLSSGQVNSWRLERHHLLHRARRKDISTVVSDVCGIQAQVLSAAELALRARVEGITQRDVRGALWEDHSVVKTWCMRGTLHLLATSDLPTYVAALKTKLPGIQKWLGKQGVKPSEVNSITRGIKAALKGRTVLREDLIRQVESRTKLSRATSRAFRSAWGILLRPAAYEGLLTFGPSVGPKTTFFRPDELVRDWREPSVREAFRNLFHRFVRAYGPVLINDFAHWWGNLRGEERSILESSRSDLVEVRVGNHRGWMNQSGGEEAAGMEQIHSARLLPSFDCYAMFYSPREMFVPKAHRSRIFRQTAGWNYPALVVDGFAAGIWGMRKRSRKVEINLELFRELTAAEKRLVKEDASGIGEFYGLPAEVRFTPIG